MHRVSETHDMRRRENVALLNKLKIIRNRAITAAHARNTFAGFYERPDEERTLMHAKAFIEVSTQLMSGLRWSEVEKVILYPGALDILDRLEGRLIAFLDMCARFQQDYPNLSAEVVTDDVVWLRSVVEQATAVGELSDQLVVLVDAQQDGIRAAMDNQSVPRTTD